MKHTLLLLIFVHALYQLQAQSPDAFKWQGVVNDAAGNPINGNIALRFSILKANATGTAVYIETHATLAAMKGQVSANVGAGVSSGVNFSAIDWSSGGPFYLKIELKTGNATTFVIMGTTQLLSVPFALYAVKSGSTISGSSNSTWAATTNGGTSTTLKVGIGTNQPLYPLDVNGRIRTKVIEITGGSDFCENFSLAEAATPTDLQPTPGMLVSIHPAATGKLQITQQANDTKVVGIISGAGDVRPGMIMGQEGTIANGDYPIAIAGRVYVQADATLAPIMAGDFLTSSHLPGYAAKALDIHQCQGAIIGKAMTNLAQGKGLVLVFVNLQ